MADDPNRDILPVKDDSFCVDTCRSSIDPRERHLVYKLDRYELEDKYLRLLDEANNLKKLSNCQEEKIKRLATKLMRVTSNPRACTTALDIYDDKKKIIALELQNSKLKDKIAVLRNQLLSHTIASRSSSRSRNPQARPSSGRITCRSESSRTKIPSCHCIVRDGNDDDQRSNPVRIEELEAQKKEMAYRISQLEKELSVCAVSNQREKAAENVEYIRVWRQMKQLNDKLMVAQSSNDSLNGQINDLKRKLEEATKNNKVISAALLTEKQRAAEVDEEALKAKDSQLSLREKDNEIQDLMDEVKILQQHNSELIALSSKYGEVELENTELKRKVSEQQQDQDSLKTVVNNEQANIVALQNSNDQLLGKLQELQKNIDTLTVQLTSFQTQTEKQETSKTTQISTKQYDKKNTVETENVESYKDTGSQAVRGKKCCDGYEKILHLEETVVVTKGPSKLKDTSAQTDRAVQLASKATKDQGTSVMTPVKEKPKEEPTPQQNTKETRAGNPLTPEKMLTLLEQAQISTPLDAARFGHKVDNNDYNGILDLNQRHSGTEKVTRASQEIPATTTKFQRQKSDKSPNPEQPMDIQLANFSKMLSFLFDIFRGCPSESKISPEPSELYRPKPVISHLDVFGKDMNNNTNVESCRVTKKSPNIILSDQHVVNDPLKADVLNESCKVSKPATSYVRGGCSTRRYCSNVYNRLRQEKLKKNIFSTYKRRSQVMKFADSDDCTCDDLMNCRFNSDCERECCNNNSVKPFTVCASNSKNMQYELPSTTKNPLRNIDSAVQNDLCKASVQNYTQTVGTMYLARKLQDEGVAGPYRIPGRNRIPEKKNDMNDDSKMLRGYVKHLDKCRELLNISCPLNSVTDPAKEMCHATNANRARYRLNKEQRMLETRKIESFCSLNCPNECIDTANTMPDSFPLVIMDGQGLMELHIVSLQLSTSAKQILFQENDIGNVSLFISWNIWNQETTSTPRLKCPKLNFNSSFVYRIPDLFSFFNYVLLEFVKFQVNVYHEDSENYSVATGKLSIKDMLDYPQNKLHYIAPVNSVLSCSLGVNFGQLSLWVRLSCDVEKVKEFKEKRGLQRHTEFSENGPEEYPTDRPVDTSAKAPVVFPTVYPANKPVITPAKAPMLTSIEIMPPPSIMSVEASTGSMAPKDSAGESALLTQQYQSSQLNVESIKELLVHENTDKPLSLQDVPLHGYRSSESSDENPNDNQPRDVMDDVNGLTVMKGSVEPIIDFGKSDETLGLPELVSELPDQMKEERRITKSERKPDSSAKPTAAGEGEEKKGEETQTETSSVAEFNAIIKDKSADTTRANSDDTIYELSTVFSEKNWEEYRRRRSVRGDEQNERELTHENTPERETIVIEILNMILLPKSSVLTNDEIQLLYIEFSFLGYCGANMETDSLRKPKPPDQKLTYNFRKKFRVDPIRNAVQDNILHSMLHDSGSPNIKFIVVCEPLPEETDTKECVEVGYALFNIKEHALGNSEDIVSLPIFSPDDREQIGFLKIFVSGVDIIRQRLTRRASSMQ